MKGEDYFHTFNQICSGLLLEQVEIAIQKKRSFLYYEWPYAKNPKRDNPFKAVLVNANQFGAKNKTFPQHREH